MFSNVSYILKQRGYVCYTNYRSCLITYIANLLDIACMYVCSYVVTKCMVDICIHIRMY